MMKHQRGAIPIAVIIAGGVAVLGIILVVTFISLQGQGGVPDPGAKIRKEYTEKKKGAKTKEKEATKPEKEEPKEDKVTEVKTPEKTTIVKKDAPQKPEEEKGVNVGIINNPITEPMFNEEASSAPINPPYIPPGPTIVDQPALNPNQVQSAPPVPVDLLNQPLPEVDKAPAPPPVQVRTRIIPKRYLFNNLDPSAEAGGTVEVYGQGADFSLEHFSPVGEDISAALMLNVAGNNFEVPVQAAVWEPFYFQGHRLLNTGEKLIGTAAAGKTRDRLRINFSRIIFKDGKSLGISGLALNTDGTVGVPGYIVGDSLLNALMPILFEAATTFADTIQDKAEDVYVTPEGTVIKTQSDELANDTQTAGIAALRKVGDRINEMIETDIEENKPYIVVPAGTMMKVRLMSPIDVSQADYGN